MSGEEVTRLTDYLTAKALHAHPTLRVIPEDVKAIVYQTIVDTLLVFEGHLSIDDLRPWGDDCNGM